MPPPFKVELCPYDPLWAENAAKEGNALGLAIGPPLLTIHHVGSTSIPGIHAKLILDLMPVVSSLSELDGQKSNITALGYEWWGELAYRAGATAQGAILGRAVNSSNSTVMLKARQRSSAI